MLVDTCVWMDHLRRRNATLSGLLERGEVWTHPFVIGELACLNILRRAEFLDALAGLPRAPVVPHEDVLRMVAGRRLMRRGLGWMNVHLLAAAALVQVPLLTHDVRLAVVAGEFDLGWPAAGAPAT